MLLVDELLFVEFSLDPIRGLVEFVPFDCVFVVVFPFRLLLFPVFPVEFPVEFVADTEESFNGLFDGSPV